MGVSHCKAAICHLACDGVCQAKHGPSQQPKPLKSIKNLARPLSVIHIQSQK